LTGHLAYLKTQPYASASGAILPALPYFSNQLSAAGLPEHFVARFSIRRDQLIAFTELVAVPAGTDPNASPAAILFSLPVNDLPDLRRAQNANGPNAAAIKALVKLFDDFVFHVEKI
jgi:hypothetical protein